MDPITYEFKIQGEKAIENLKEDLNTVRTGRASPALVENIIVETYKGNTKLRLLELATITNEDPLTLSIIPFDPSTIVDIEKAILKSPLGTSPQNQGGKLILKLPPLSLDQREKILKIVREKIEEKKQIIRNFRDEARKKIKVKFEKKEIGEDQKYRMEKEINLATQSLMDEIQKIKEIKEKEIMQK